MTELTNQVTEAKDGASVKHNDWDAAKYEAALAQLEQLDRQIRELSSTILDLVNPLVSPAPTAPQLYAQIKKAAVQTTDNLQNFRKSYTSDEVREVLNQAKQSYAKDSDLTRADELHDQNWSTSTKNE